MKLIDLSLELAQGMPRYPSPYLPDVELRPAATHEKEARSAQILVSGTHVSTHLDAPYHACPDGMKIDEIPLNQLIGRALVVRILDRDKGNPITVDDIAKLGSLTGVQKLVIDTGWLRKTWGSAEYFTEGPFLTRDATRLLAEAPDLHMIGMDFPNIDSGADMRMGVRAPNHVILLERKIILLENLINLELIEEPDFLLMAQPIKLTGGDGCPTRAVAAFPIDEAAAWLGKS
ncbi:MAG TPA: cyclase family protein [Magnetovibrio sp.]